MEVYYSVVLFIFGTIFGSFFNVVASRLPEGKSIVNPPSHCTNCKKQLTPIELIPIISYVIQGGKCKGCKTKFSIVHPLYELVCGLMFMGAYLVFGFNLELLIALTFISILLISVASDFYYMIIIDEVLIVGVILLLIEILIIKGLDSLINSLIGGIIAFIVMFSIKLLGDFLFKKESMGGGDIKLLFVFGLILGAPLALISIFLGSIIALPVSLIILIKNKEHIIPFGPFLSIGAIILYFSKIDFDLILDILTTN